MRLMLIGNPNVGKTTLFNNLTGAHGTVGNWSGVTVDKIVGTIKGTDSELTDLPGTYSVTPNSEDEGVVTYALMNEPYEGILNIVDVAHLKRNLHLTIQLLETGNPVLVTLNMMDELVQKGKKINIERLEGLLGVPVIPIVARKQEGMDELKTKIPQISNQENWAIDYGPMIETSITKINDLLVDSKIRMNSRWMAIQILEGNEGIFKEIQLTETIQKKIRYIVEETELRIINEKLALSLKGAIFNRRREFISEICETCLETDALHFREEQTKLLKIDRYLTHPILGLLIFFVLMFFIYALTFDFLGNPISDGFAGALDELVIPWLSSLLLNLGLSENGMIYGALIDGLVAGVGGVIVFLPQILILFFCLSMMEATGYMARVAIVMDTIFSKFGLNGKAIVPLVTGFGCNVPAIMATRTIPDRKERLKTITIIPFMSCSARLPIYVLFVSLFFPNHQALIIMFLYILGIIVALLSAKLLSVSIFKKADDNFVLEVPPYRIPQFKNIMAQTFNRATEFFHTAGKFIIIGSIILWFLQAVGPTGFNVESEESFLAILGGFLAPIFIPIGLGTWQAVSSLVVGFLAKELVASSMIIICAGEAGILSLFSPMQAISFLIFSLLYVPCLATVGVMYRETKSAKDTAWMVGFGLVIAYIVSFIVYHIGSFFI